MEIGTCGNGGLRNERAWRHLAWATALTLLAAAAAHAQPRPAISPFAYQITQIQPVAGNSRSFDVTARAGVFNPGDPATNVTAGLTSNQPASVVLDGEVHFGNVPRTTLLRPVISQDTFALRITVPRIMSFRELLAFVRSLHGSLVWQLSCDNCGTNRPPVANAGADQTAYVQQLVTLDGSGSSDPDGNALTFEWTLAARPAGSAATLGNRLTVNPTLTPDREGEYAVQLVVRDGSLASAIDTVIVSTLNSAPVANAGPDRTAFVSERVQLDGSGSSDVDGDPLSYAWGIVQRPATSAAAIERPNDVNPTFTPDMPGDYVLELVVNDGTVSSVPDTIVISTRNSRPVANAGADQTARLGDTALLDGSNSSDADRDPLTYRWSLILRPAESGASLAGATTATPSLTLDRSGVYIVQLIVNDGQVDSEPDTVSVTASNTNPVARDDTAVTTVNAAVQISVLANDTDEDGDALTVSDIGAPSSGTAALQGTAILYTPPNSFTGTATFTYSISDGFGGSASATVTVTVTAVNRNPIAQLDSVSTSANTAITIAVLANDSDPDGDPLTLAGITQPAAGTAAIQGTSVLFTPAAGFSGTTTFSYTISDGRGGEATAGVSVDVSPALPSLSIDDVSVSEGDDGTSTLVFTVTLSAPSTLPTTVNYATANSSATTPEDYVAVSGAAVIPAGSTSADISVMIQGDAVAEPDEELVITLSNAVNATIGDGQGIGEIVDDDEGAPTTFELITQAFVAGLIDEESALTYKVFAEFRDDRLPSQYQGRDDGFFEATALMAAAVRFDSLSSAAQTTLAPFLEFPDLVTVTGGDAPQDAATFREQIEGTIGNASSLAGPSSSPMNAESVTYTQLVLIPGVVRMAWIANSPLSIVLEDTAKRLKAELLQTIWPKLTIFLGTPSTGKEIQILLYDTPGRSYMEPRGDCSTAKINLYRFDNWTFVHELTHALLRLNFPGAACKVSETSWMHEATATWSQHYVYPPANLGREQITARYFLFEPNRSLFATDGEAKNIGHEYGAYLWFFRLAGQENNPGIVRAIWQAADSGKTSLEAIESVLRVSGFGGFEEQWPKFALDNWNRVQSADGPYRKYFQWDKLNYKTTQADFVPTLSGNAWQAFPLAYDLPPLSADYQRFDFTNDQNVRGILFQIPDTGNEPTASFHAIIKIKNQPWRQATPWSGQSDHYFCRDKADENVEEIVLVIANRGFRDADPEIEDNGSFNLFLSALPCADWTGTTTLRAETVGPGIIEDVFTATATNLRFRLNLTQGTPGPVGPQGVGGVWRAIEGVVNWTHVISYPSDDGSCTARESGAFLVTGLGSFLLSGLKGAGGLQFSGAGMGNQVSWMYRFTCTNGSDFTLSMPLPGAWFQTGPAPWPVDPGATTITGDWMGTDPVVRQSSTWSLSKNP